MTICPLAFGEIDVKERVKNVLNYKKPAFWIIAGAQNRPIIGNLQNVSHLWFRRWGHIRGGNMEQITGGQFQGSLHRRDQKGVFFHFRNPRLQDVLLPGNALFGPEPQVGDILEITYDGSILESYPAQFGTIYSMRVISQADSLEIDGLRCCSRGTPCLGFVAKNTVTTAQAMTAPAMIQNAGFL